MKNISRRTLLGALAGTAAAAATNARSLQTPASPSAAAGVYQYLHLDVFTDRPLAGNQLAVYLDPQGLTTEVMQAIAREMSFSETTFVFPPERQGTDFKVRIFTETSELPFAGHPVIGTAFALAEAGRIERGRTTLVFELGLGPTPLDLEWGERSLQFAWMTQLRPTFGPVVGDASAVAAALGLDRSAIRSTGVPIQEVSCGSAFIFVPVATRALVDSGLGIGDCGVNAEFSNSGLRTPSLDSGVRESRRVAVLRRWPAVMTFRGAGPIASRAGARAGARRGGAPPPCAGVPRCR